MIQTVSGGGPLSGVDGQTASDEVASGFGDGVPVLCGLELVVAADDGFHFLLLGISVEGCVTAEQEVGDDAHRPDVDWFAVASCGGKVKRASA